MTGAEGVRAEPGTRDETSDPRSIDRVELANALRCLSDVIDPAEGPVILAWGVPQLADALFRLLTTHTPEELAVLAVARVIEERRTL